MHFHIMVFEMASAAELDIANITIMMCTAEVLIEVILALKIIGFGAQVASVVTC